MPFGNVSRPSTWEEDGYTVVRTTSWSPPGDHPTAAGMLLYIKDGKIEKVEGDPEHPLTRGALPARLLSFTEYLYSPERVLYPMRRDPAQRGNNEAWERCTWDEAYDQIATKWHEIVDDYGTGEPIVVYVGTGRSASSYSAVWAGGVFNSPHACYIQSGWSCAGPRTSMNAWVLGGPYAFTDWGAQFIDGIDNSNYVVPEVYVLWGSEPLKSNPDGYWGHSIVDLYKRGMKLIVVDPRLTWEAARAEYWLQLRPGTDAALAMAMCNVIISEKLYDAEFVDLWCYGFEEFAERVATMPASKAAEICGVDEEDIIGAARLYATANPGTLDMGLAVDQNPNGNQVVHCLDAMLAICGNIDKPGATVFGPLDLGVIDSGFGLLDPPNLIDKQTGIEEYPGLVRTLLFDDPDSMLDQLETGKPYPIRMGVFLSANMIACGCNVPARWEAALNTAELNICIDPILGPTAEACCDIFLPVCTFAEMDYYASFWYGAVGCDLMGIKKAIEPMGETKSDLTILREVGLRTRPEIWSQWPTDLDYLNKLKFANLGVTLEEIQEHGWWMVDYEYEKYKTGKLRFDGKPGFATPTGRIELYSTMIASWGDDPLPYYKEPPTSPISTPDYAEEYPFVLSTGQRTWSYFHSENRHIPLLREIEPWPRFEINDKDAGRLGIVDGDWCWLENDNGRAMMKASVWPSVKEGCIFAQHGWWYPECKSDSPSYYDVYEVNINNLVPYKTVGTLGFGAPFKCLMCKVYKVDASEVE